MIEKSIYFYLSELTFPPENPTTMATHHLPPAAVTTIEDRQSLMMPHPLSSWTSRAGVLLNPDPVLGPNLGRFNNDGHARIIPQQHQGQQLPSTGN